MKITQISFLLSYPDCKLFGASCCMSVNICESSYSHPSNRHLLYLFTDLTRRKEGLNQADIFKVFLLSKGMGGGNLEMEVGKGSATINAMCQAV